MDDIVTHILALSLVLVFSPYLSKIFRLPTAPIEIVIGSILAYMGWIVSSGEEGGGHYFELVAEVGFLYLMFLAGLEINLKSIKKIPQKHLIQSIIFLLILGLLATILGQLVFNLNAIITASLPLISVGLLATISKEHGKDTQWVSMALLVGVIGEVLSITILTILEVSVEVGFSNALFYKIVLLVGFLAIVWGLYYFIRLVFWWYPELKTVMMPHIDGKDQDFRLAMGIFFIMIVIMKLIDLELAFGAFIAGLFISTFFHHRRQLEHKISSFGFGFLVPIFFIHVGASFDFSFFYISIGTAIKILLVMIMIRIIAAYSLVKLLGERDSLLVALSLSMPLTLLVATATVGFHHGFLHDFEYNALILASLLEVIVSMVAIKLIAKRD